MKSRPKTAQRRAASAPTLPNLAAALEQKLGPIEYWSLQKIAAYAGNPRKHPEQQIVQLTASIGHFGFVMPLLVSETGELICGHARLEAARRLGLQEVPVIIARFWSNAQIKAYRLADNQLASAASWDENLPPVPEYPVARVGDL